jgi:rhomboid protease GluP
MSKYISTLVLIGINIIVFAIIAIKQESLLMTRSFDVLAILHAGGNLNPFTMDGEQWRVVSSMFLHIGVVHLLANMVGLFFLGSRLEPQLGTLRFCWSIFFVGLPQALQACFSTSTK